MPAVVTSAITSDQNSTQDESILFVGEIAKSPVCAPPEEDQTDLEGSGGIWVYFEIFWRPATAPGSATGKPGDPDATHPISSQRNSFAPGCVVAAQLATADKPRGSTAGPQQPQIQHPVH